MSQIALIDGLGKLCNCATYPGEETSAFAFSSERALATLVTNERTLRIFDLEEI